jgi:hypothetical protein
MLSHLEIPLLVFAALLLAGGVALLADAGRRLLTRERK